MIRNDFVKDQQWGTLTCIRFSPDGAWLATGSRGKPQWSNVYLWNLKYRKPVERRPDE